MYFCVRTLNHCICYLLTVVLVSVLIFSFLYLLLGFVVEIYYWFLYFLSFVDLSLELFRDLLVIVFFFSVLDLILEFVVEITGICIYNLFF